MLPTVATTHVIATARPRSKRLDILDRLSGPTMRDEPFRPLLIGDKAAGRRVDVFLALRFNDWSRAAFARWIKEGRVVSEDRPIKPSSTLRMGERLRIYVPGIAPIEAAPEMPPVLWEDELMIALNKPPGMLMHPVGQKWAYSLLGTVRTARPGIHIDLAHRLDRETSGVVLVTKDPSADRHMKACFQSRAVGKIYWAIVRGLVPWEEEIVDAPLGHKPGSRVNLRIGVVEGGDHAVTRFKVVRRMAEHTLVACKPLTGRTHQIRVHLEHLGFPILGDKLYGQPDDVWIEHLANGPTDAVKAAIGFPRHCLHARGIIFPHPTSGQKVRVKAPLPDDMKAIVLGATPSYP